MGTPGQWDAIVGASPELADNPDGARLVVERLEGQYIPALAKANTHDQRDRVWLAFWSYLTAAISPRKPFRMSPREADALIEKVQGVLAGEEPRPAEG